MRIEDFIAQVNELINSTSARALIGIVGKPGAGKSTIVETIKSHFPQNVISIVSMDGFHLSNEILEATGKRERKGAPDTFDQEGFIALLTHLKTGGEDIHFPIFHREIEAAIADEGMVPKEVKIVLVEGNYLLSTEFGWEGVRDLLSASYFLELEDSVRLERLIARHIKHGKSPEAARAWSLGSDESNARFINSTRHLATAAINLNPAI
ncbi:MAG: nucleoside/nucleotide kinase family protein [Actinomycetes bacterium]